MEIGTLRQRITLQEHRTVVDEVGNHNSSWADFFSCFAYVNLASGKEYGVIPVTGEEQTLVFILRWCRKLKELNSREYRIMFEEEVYNILCGDDVQFLHKKLKLTAKKEPRG